MTTNTRANINASAQPRWYADARLRIPLVLVTVLTVVALCANFVAPYPPNEQLDIIGLKHAAPSFAHPFGTDALSRDVLSRVIVGARVSLTVAIASVALGLTIGVAYGASAAIVGGHVETLMMRVLDVALSIPRLLILLALNTFWELRGEQYVILILGLTGWYDIARIVRNEVSGFLTRDFVLAGRAVGVRRSRLVWRHIMPHMIPTLVVTATLGIASTIALEAGLSFLGFGTQIPDASWGSIMVGGKIDVRGLWWLTVFPGAAIIIAVLACNALGDALRDTFAPKQVPHQHTQRHHA